MGTKLITLDIGAAERCVKSTTCKFIAFRDANIYTNLSSFTVVNLNMITYLICYTVGDITFRYIADTGYFGCLKLSCFYLNRFNITLS